MLENFRANVLKCLFKYGSVLKVCERGTIFQANLFCQNGTQKGKGLALERSLLVKNIVEYPLGRFQRERVVILRKPRRIDFDPSLAKLQDRFFSQTHGKGLNEPIERLLIQKNFLEAMISSKTK